jgi:tetratricopeptide (TPR) repeat protein
MKRVAGAWTFVCLIGCAGRTSEVVPRTLQGSLVRGSFVPPSSYEAYVRGELLLLEGKPAQALAQFELAATAPDEDPYLLSRMAHAQRLTGALDDAERTLRHAERLDPCAEAVWLMRAELLEQRAELARAEAALEKATACAPRSPAGELALAQLLDRQGKSARALEVLTRAAQRPFGGPATSALERALASAQPAALAHALSGLGMQRASDLPATAHAIRIALDRQLPRLALRLREQNPAKLPARLEAEVLEQNGRRDELAALIALSDADELGGPAHAAALALRAGAFERAELEATSALASQRSDHTRQLRARARIALGRIGDALGDIREVGDATMRRTLIVEALARTGAGALASEVEARGFAHERSAKAEGAANER